MTVLPRSVCSVMARFPESCDRVLRLLQERESFRSICDDYEQCLLSLRHWRESGIEEAAARRVEYAALLDDLEAEIRQQLDAAQGGGREEDDVQGG